MAMLLLLPQFFQHLIDFIQIILAYLQVGLKIFFWYFLLKPKQPETSLKKPPFIKEAGLQILFNQRMKCIMAHENLLLLLKKQNNVKDPLKIIESP